MHSYSARKVIVMLALILSSAAIGLSLVACSAPKGNSLNGQRWYSMNNCSSCHGDKGKNGLAPEIVGLQMGFGSFLEYLRNPDSPSKPTYSKAKISKQDAADIYVWLKENRQ